MGVPRVAAASWRPPLARARLGAWRGAVFVTDAWASRALLGERAPYHPLGLPPTGLKNAAVPNDLDARPALPEMLRLRDERLAVVREMLGRLTDAALEEEVRVRGAGYPRPGVFPVRRCVTNLLHEEWHHRRYAERDLTVLEHGRSSLPRTPEHG